MKRCWIILRELAARWESGIGFRLATDDPEAQKRSRGSSGEATKNEGRVLHHCAGPTICMRRLVQWIT